MTIFSVILVSAIAIWFLLLPKRKKSGLNVPETFPTQWRTFLSLHIDFYQQLNEEDKHQFERDILRFLRTVRITGIKTEVDDEDLLYVACSAVIPVFAFPEWEYSTLTEVLLYPDLFTEAFDVEDKSRNISGMVGSGGVMNNIVILSKPALHQGFENNTDKKNVGIHEFVHLFDKQDGSIDGIPNVMMNNQAALPWLQMIRKKTAQMLERQSDINIYGATNNQEFFAVAAEYFFERPKLLERKHPKLYRALSEVFKQDLAETFGDTNTVKRSISRNDPCPCGSGKKFKKCCMKQR